MTEMNKTIAFFQRRTMYIKELKPLCGGSTSAVILMQQLEYRFSGKEKGFYKFLEPSETHHLYRQGDSWSEEMGFSKKEFRNAFDKIGVRYSSKQDFETAAKKHGDPFLVKEKDKKGNEKLVRKLYLSYLDNGTRLTWYLRNHDLVNNSLQDLIDSFLPENNAAGIENAKGAQWEPHGYPHKKEAENSEVIHREWLGCPMGTPGIPNGNPTGAQWEPRYNKESNITANITAAANNLSQELERGNNGEPIKAAAAVFEETKNIPAQEPKADTFGDNEAACKKHPVILHADDYLIRSDLSDNQTDRIAEQVSELCKKFIGSGVDKSQLRDQYFDGKDFTAVCGILGSVILDKTKFTRCASHFPKKLSATLGEIERGNFYSLAADVEKKHCHGSSPAPTSKPAEPSEAQVLQRRIANIKCELNSHVQSLKTPIAQDTNFAQATNERIAELQTELEQQRNLLEDLQGADHQANDAVLLSNNVHNPKRLNGSAC